MKKYLSSEERRRLAQKSIDKLLKKYPPYTAKELAQMSVRDQSVMQILNSILYRKNNASI